MPDVIDGLEIVFGERESPMPLYLRAEITPAQLQALEREIAGLRGRLCAYESAVELYPRAWKLMLKGKFFLVVAIDEPYFPGVYHLIRGREREIGRWTVADQERMDEAMSEHCHLKGADDAGCK